MIRQHRLVEPVTKFMILLGGLFTSNASAQHNLSAVKLPHGPIYPYRDKSGKFGYADESLRIHIQPQYHTAGLFTPQGFAIITDSLGRKGVIDTNNTKIIPALYDQIHLSETEDFTLVETYHWYDVRWRFWEWQFLPGFSFLGARGDNRLFDTKVKRLKRTVLILRDRPKKVRRECLTDNGLKNNYFKLRILDGNQILIDDRLYQIRANGAHFLAAGVKELLSSQTLAQHKNQRLYLINRKGKRLKGQRYRTIDAIPMRLGADLLMTPLARASSRPIATTYQNDEGRIFIYPDFSKAFPLLINENPRPEDPSAKALIQGLWLLASVPRSDYFVCISNLNGKQYYRFLDRQGNWHRNLPPSISFYGGPPFWRYTLASTRGLSSKESDSRKLGNRPHQRTRRSRFVSHWLTTGSDGTTGHLECGEKTLVDSPRIRSNLCDEQDATVAISKATRRIMGHPRCKWQINQETDLSSPFFGWLGPFKGKRRGHHLLRASTHRKSVQGKKLRC